MGLHCVEEEFVFLEQVIGDEEGRLMKKKINYTDEPIEFEVIEDFLPPPDQLILKDE